MTTKLTLSIDEEKVKKIKQYSKEKGISISKIVEQHIDNLTENENRKKLDISNLKGVFGNDPDNLDWKKVKTEHLIKKYAS